MSDRKDARTYWEAVERERDRIDVPYPYVTSRELPVRRIAGGVTSQVDRATAARLIVDQTHILATPEDVERYHQQEEEQRRVIAAAEERNLRNRVFVPAAMQPQYIPADAKEPGKVKK